MPLAISAIVAGVWVLVSGWKGWTLTELFSDDRPADGSPWNTSVGPSPFQSAQGSLAEAATTFSNALPQVSSKASLNHLKKLATDQFGLRVTSTTGGQHAPNSWHYKGRAIDVAGPPERMAAYANYVADKYGGILLELFWNGQNAINIKDGKRVTKGFVSGHTDHVHVAI